MKNAMTFIKPITVAALGFMLGMVAYDLYKNMRDKRALRAAQIAVEANAAQAE